ncbi:MAG TPA: helix-turn-helix domain-containing protein [Ilumatobacter sp.]|nr:helix-turn-helix domain-containing protein [Ilumatobacter sp.]
MIEWLSIPEVAKRLGVSVRTLYAIVNRGELTAYRFGRVYRIMSADIDKFLDNVRVKPGDLDHLIPSWPPQAIELRDDVVI